VHSSQNIQEVEVAETLSDYYVLQRRSSEKPYLPSTRLEFDSLSTYSPCCVIGGYVLVRLNGETAKKRLMPEEV
jgi:hypothetical protein